MARVFVIGGTGNISAHTVAKLTEEGHEITVFNRGIRPVAAASKATLIIGERGDRRTLAEAIDSARPDVLIDFVCFDPSDASVLVEAAVGLTGHLVFVSTVDVFGFPLRVMPVPESEPPNPPVGAYAEKKLACELLLRDGLHGRLPLTIVRPTLSLGRGFVIAFFDLSSAAMMNRIRNGLPVVVPGDGRGLIHPSASSDTGAMIARVAGDARAFGKAYTCGTDGAWRSHDAYVGLIASILGREPELVHIPKSLIDELPLPEITTGLYYNVARFDLAFGFEGFKTDFPDFRWEGDLAAPIRAYVERIEGLGTFARLPEPGIDDRLIAAWASARGAFRAAALGD